MTATAADPRHRAVELLERVLADDGCSTSAHLARALVARLEAAGLVIRDAPVAKPQGRCDFHQKALPCDGCIADAKGKRDEETP